MWPVLCGTAQCTGFVVCVPRVCRHRHPICEELAAAPLKGSTMQRFSFISRVAFPSHCANFLHNLELFSSGQAAWFQASSWWRHRRAVRKTCNGNMIGQPVSTDQFSYVGYQMFPCLWNTLHNGCLTRELPLHFEGKYWEVVNLSIFFRKIECLLNILFCLLNEISAWFSFAVYWLPSI